MVCDVGVWVERARCQHFCRSASSARPLARSRVLGPPSQPTERIALRRAGWRATPKCPRDDIWRKTDAKL